MTKYIGRDGDFTVGGTSLDCLISVDRSVSQDTVETTCGSDTDKTHLPADVGNTYTVNWYAQEDEAEWDLFATGSALLACVYYPRGNASTKPSETFNAIVTSKERSVSRTDAAACTVTLEVTGGVTEGTVA